MNYYYIKWMLLTDGVRQIQDRNKKTRFVTSTPKNFTQRCESTLKLTELGSPFLLTSRSFFAVKFYNFNISGDLTSMVKLGLVAFFLIVAKIKQQQSPSRGITSPVAEPNLSAV